MNSQKVILENKLKSNEKDESIYNRKDIVIYNIDNVDKIYKEIIEATEKIQMILIKPLISGSPLEIETDKPFSTINLKNNIKYNSKKKTLIMPNKESFKGIFIEEKVNEKKEKKVVEKTFLSLKNGVYKWPSGEKYQGSFNKNNDFEGKGNLERKGNKESFSFESEFKNGYPFKNGIFKLNLKNLYDLYIQSNVIQNSNPNSRFNLILDGKTIIVKTQKGTGTEIYRFDGEIKNQKIVGYATIKRKYKVLRNIEINLNYESNENYENVQNLDMEINEEKNKGFYYKAKYVNGLKIDKYTLTDKKENIYVRNKESELSKIIIKFKKIMLNKFGGNSFEKMYTYKLSEISKFNRTYKTKINEKDQLVHIINRSIDLKGMIFLCRAELFNLKDLALNDSKITDISPLEKANFPLLESLSLGKNQIESINSINRLPFPKLKLIMLGYNKIKDISPLNQYKSENIRVLAFIGNLIEDISPLEKINAPNLEQINIGGKIKDISSLTKCNFPKLKQLGLKGNAIKDITPLINVKFPLLELLYLNNNSIVDINPLKNANFPNLLNLGLDHNNIRKIIPLIHLKVKSLNFLNISHNKFRPTSSENLEIIDILRKKVRDIKY